MTIHHRPADPHPDCALDHHRIGRHVQWSAFDRALQRSVIHRGVVVAHRPHMRFIAIRRLDGREIGMPCGPVAAWIGAQR